LQYLLLTSERCHAIIAAEDSMTTAPKHVAIYARVSTLDQEPENQLAELRRYIEARGWTAIEYVDRGISGARESRPQLDALMADAKRRKFDAVCCWRLDRLGRNLKHLVGLLSELQALDVAFISLGEGIDCSTPAGKLQLHILAALAEFERGRIQERIKAGLARARAQGKPLGRPAVQVSASALESVAHLSIRQAAAALGVGRSVIHAYRQQQVHLGQLSGNPTSSEPTLAPPLAASA
jgi:DNA invertase Pin-like site-specific DNA recombinase